MKRGLWVVVGIITVLIFVALLVYGSFKSTQNQLVALDEQVRTSWSDVDIQLQRRADLIPNLVETVKGFTKEENSVFSDIANARAGLLNAHTPQDKIRANGSLDSAFGRLLALTENYPQLRSNEEFLRLQDELSGTENRISVARRRYNDSLRSYNTFVREFPNSLWAKSLGFAPNTAYFEASQSARTAPAVKF